MNRTSASCGMWPNTHKMGFLKGEERDETEKIFVEIMASAQEIQERNTKRNRLKSYGDVDSVRGRAWARGYKGILYFLLNFAMKLSGSRVNHTKIRLSGILIVLITVTSEMADSGGTLWPSSLSP